MLRYSSVYLHVNASSPTQTTEEPVKLIHHKNLHRAAPEANLLFITFAGTPPTTLPAGTSLLTTAPAAITQPSPIVTPSSTYEPAPNQQPRPICMPSRVTPCRRIGVSGSVNTWFSACMRDRAEHRPNPLLQVFIDFMKSIELRCLTPSRLCKSGSNVKR